MISVSKMKNSVYHLIGLKDSCICDHYLTEFFCQILAMISVSKMKNSVYHLIGLEDSCICDNYLTEFFCQLRLLNTHFHFSMRLAQIRQKVTDCCIWPDLYCR